MRLPASGRILARVRHGAAVVIRWMLVAVGLLKARSFGLARRLTLTTVLGLGNTRRVGVTMPARGFILNMIKLH